MSGASKRLALMRLLSLESHTDLQRVENYAETLASLLGDNNGLLLMAATRRCKALGARLSIQLNAVMVNDATSIELINGTLCAEHRMYGGLAFGKENLNSPQAIITLAPGVLEPALPFPGHTCPETTLAYIAPRREVLCHQRRAKSLSSVDLSKAKRVIGVGRAWRRKAILIWCINWQPYLALKWAAPAPLQKARTGWNASAILAYPACC
nr:electron transfer flavoprotein subunit alpha [Salmonella sp. NCTC 7297]